jgi:superfamily II DNA helicase RecQ
MSKTAKQRELLVALRAKLIGTKHTLPFTIYSDETIEDLLKAQPATLEELAKVKGFPANGKRVAGFGECIVKIFTSTDEVSNITVETSGDGVNVKTELKKLSLF